MTGRSEQLELREFLRLSYSFILVFVILTYEL